MSARIVMIDCGAESYAARCTACAWFRGASHGDKEAAARDADEHRRREHPAQLRQALRKRRQRARQAGAAEMSQA